MKNNSEFLDPQEAASVLSETQKLLVEFDETQDQRLVPQIQQMKDRCLKALETFSKASPGEYESREKLEQLRAMENGLSIGAIETMKEIIGLGRLL